MGVGDAQIGKCGGTVRVVLRPRGKREPVSLPHSRAKDGVHETCGAGFARRAREIHCIVDGGRCRNAGQVKDLIEAQSQQRHDLDVEPADRAARKVRDQVVDSAPPAERAGDDLGCQRAVPLVRQPLTTLRQRRWKVDAFVLDASKGGEGRRTGGCNHGTCVLPRTGGGGSVNLSPGWTRWPARKSRARIGRRPSGWTSSTAMRPCPVATSKLSEETTTIVPGLASAGSTSGCVRRRISRRPPKQE